MAEAIEYIKTLQTLNDSDLDTVTFEMIVQRAVCNYLPTGSFRNNYYTCLRSILKKHCLLHRQKRRKCDDCMHVACHAGLDLFIDEDGFRLNVLKCNVSQSQSQNPVNCFSMVSRSETTYLF